APAKNLAFMSLTKTRSFGEVYSDRTDGPQDDIATRPRRGKVSAASHFINLPDRTSLMCASVQTAVLKSLNACPVHPPTIVERLNEAGRSSFLSLGRGAKWLRLCRPSYTPEGPVVYTRSDA